MPLRFDFQKGLQASGVLLRLEDGQMPFMRLLKLLYIAERETLAETAAPIVGDRVVAMARGPVMAHVYDLIKGQSSGSAEWSASIETRGYAVKLVDDPGRGRLSKGEIEKLTDVSERYRSKDHWEISELTHDFPEWRQHYPGDGPGGSYPIPWQDVLRAQGREDLIEAVEEREATLDHLHSLFGG